MNIRIDIETNGAVDIVHVSGRLVMSTIKQLTNVCEPMEANFVLDMSELMFVDNEAVEVIRSLRKKEVEVRGASTFIELLIDG
jgi:anti-anti-sigma regulatory factor